MITFGPLTSWKGQHIILIEIDTQKRRYTQRKRQFEDRGRDWSDVATSLRMSGIQQPPQARRGMECFSPGGPKGSMALPDFRHLASRTGRDLSHQVYGKLLQNVIRKGMAFKI